MPEGSGSNAGGTATPTVEELQAQQGKDRETIASLQKSVEAIPSMRADADDLRRRNAELEAGLGDPDGDGGDKPQHLTRAQVVEIGRSTAKDEIQAHVKSANEKATAEAKETLQFAGERNKWLVKSQEDFPDTKDPNGALVKKATEIFNDPNSGLSKRTKNVLDQEVISPITPSAEYDAVSRAHKLLQDAGNTATDARHNAAGSGAGAGGGGGAPAGGQSGELSNDEYLKLSPEDKESYKERRFAEKGAAAT